MTERLEGAGPGNDLVEHGGELGVMLIGGGDISARDVGEVEGDLGAYVGDFQFAGDVAEVFDCPDAAEDALADEACGCVVPFGVELVQSVLERLQDARRVDREADAQDRRRNVVTLTQSGRRHLNELEHQLDAVQEQLLAPLTTAERRQLVELLQRLLALTDSPS